MAERIVTCPACRGPSVYAPANRWRPFCSERCRQIDLGAWASEGYRVPERANTEGASEVDPAAIMLDSSAGHAEPASTVAGTDPSTRWRH